jgi:hypothetical protein
MWLVIVVVLCVALGILALLGLLAVVKELFGEGSRGADFTDSGGAAPPHDPGCAHGRHEMTP